MQSLVVDAEWEPRSEYDVSDDEQETKRAMNASQVWRNPELRVTEQKRPTPDEDEVLVRVRYAGVCGSDVSMLETDEDGYVHYSAYLRLPNVTGHEFAGEVVETGDDARLFEEGDLVTAEVTDYCGRCNMCGQGFDGHCENFEQLGFTIPARSLSTSPSQRSSAGTFLHSAKPTKRMMKRSKLPRRSNRVPSLTTACSGGPRVSFPATTTSTMAQVRSDSPG